MGNDDDQFFHRLKTFSIQNNIVNCIEKKLHESFQTVFHYSLLGLTADRVQRNDFYS